MLNSLYRLQGLEEAEQALALEKTSSSQYRELRAIKAAFTAQKQQYLRLSDEVAALEEEAATAPARIAQQENRVREEQSAIYDGSVSSPKVLAARESQLAALQDELSALRKALSDSQTELRQKQEAAQRLKADMTEQHERFRGIKETFLAEQEVRDRRLEELAQAKAQLLQGIDPSALAWFQSQRAKFDGSPVAMLDDNHVCSGCHTMTTPITYKRTTQGQQTYCEKCGRRLFVPA